MTDYDVGCKVNIYPLDYCEENCKFLNPTEEAQGELGRIFGHVCLKYNKIVKHLDAHPALYRCTECLEKIKKEMQ